MGQLPESAQKYDDKDFTNRYLRKKGLSVPASVLIAESKEDKNVAERIFPLEEISEAMLTEQGTKKK